MILIVCTSCSAALRVSGNSEEILSTVGPQSDLWPKGFHCFECGGPAEGVFETEVDDKALRTVNVTPHEALVATMGLGLPTERSCTLLDVQELLNAKKIKRVVGTNIGGTQRCIIDYFVLEDETRIYFGASTDGATVYRVTRPHRYLEKT